MLRPQPCNSNPGKPLGTEYEARSGELALDLAAEGKALAAAKDGLTVTKRGEGARAQRDARVYTAPEQGGHLGRAPEPV